jgi:hypothetical protein
MDRLTIFGIACGACAAVVIVVYLVDRRRQLRVRREMRSLLNEYFDEKIPVEQLGRRARELAGHRFTAGNEFFSEAVSAFQRGADEKIAARAHTIQDENKLLRLLAALKNEFGLTDRYRIEAWRSGRE